MQARVQIAESKADQELEVRFARDVARVREDMAMWRRRAEEAQNEVKALRGEKATAEGALRQHREAAAADLEKAVGSGSGAREDRKSGSSSQGSLLQQFWAVLYPFALSTTTTMYRSLLVRRVFFVHLGILYCWLLLLIWNTHPRATHNAYPQTMMTDDDDPVPDSPVLGVTQSGTNGSFVFHT